VDLSKLVEFHRSHEAGHHDRGAPARFGRVELKGPEVVRFAGLSSPAVRAAGRRGGSRKFFVRAGVIDYIDNDDSTKWELAPSRTWPGRR
jgi:hypothetical protein